MACDEHYLNLIYRDSKNSTNSEKFAVTKVASSFLYSAACKMFGNSSSNVILSQSLVKSSNLLDDQTNDCINNYAFPIGSLLSSTMQTKYCGQWKSNLSNVMDYINDVDMDANIQCPHSEDKMPCLNYRDYNCEDLKCITRKIERHDLTININNQSLPHYNTKSKDVVLSKFPSDDKIEIGFNTRRTVSQESKVKKISQQVSHMQQSLGFKTARNELIRQNQKENVSKQSTSLLQRRSLGARNAPSKFVSPVITNESDVTHQFEEKDQEEDERLKHIDPKMIELIRSEIIDRGTPIGWDDIAGLEFAKNVIQEVVVWPLLRPDIFTGLRRPPRGILLFGPPGTGKTLIGKCIASQCCATFFSISASSLTSKWLGDGEKMVRALFAVARCHQPAVVFIDEIDSLLTQRSDSEHESTRRIKTEFLVQLDGAATVGDDRLLLIGATNRPQELDEAARRRLVKRLYIPLPDLKARCQIVKNLMKTERHSLSESDVNEVAQMAQGFSGADMQSLCSEAALQPIRAVPMSQIANIHSDEVRPVTIDDFKFALKRVRPSVSNSDLHQYEEWDQTYGSGTVGLVKD